MGPRGERGLAGHDADPATVSGLRAKVSSLSTEIELLEAHDKSRLQRERQVNAVSDDLEAISAKLEAVAEVLKNARRSTVVA